MGALALYYAARIGLQLHDKGLSLIQATPDGASLLMRMGQYKPPALKPPYNGVILLAFPLLTLLGMAMLVRFVAIGAPHDNEQAIG